MAGRPWPLSAVMSGAPGASDLACLIHSEHRDMFQEGQREDVVSLKGFKKVNPFPKHSVP